MQVEHLYLFILDLAIILFTTKLFGIISRKCGLPQVLGALVAGILIGIINFASKKALFNDDTSAYLKVFSEIGVVLIMFTAGMETNLKDIKKNGVPSIVITVLGVVVPLAVGIGISYIMPGDMDIKQRLFIGTILTATSVGITVAVLKDLGRLHGKVGTSIVTAAILDDIIGVVLLAFVTGKTDASSLGAKFISACGGNLESAATGVVILNVVLFIIFVVAVGLAIHYIFKFISKRYPHTRRLPIFGLCVAFLFAWASEALFGIAAISGAFAAGMMMSNMKQTDYVERRIDITTYMLFSPIFFASIGIGIDYEQLGQSFSDSSTVGLIIAFTIAFVICGMLAKLLGCGGGALMCKYKLHQSVKVGLGMMVRGEVCLIVAQKGMNVGLIDARFWPAVILLIVCSSLLTPILLKVMFKKYPEMEKPEMMPPATSGVRENSADMSHSDVCTVVAGVGGQEHGGAQEDGAQNTDPSDAVSRSDEADGGLEEIDRDED